MFANIEYPDQTRRLILICKVCLCRTKRTLGLYGITKSFNISRYNFALKHNNVFKMRFFYRQTNDKCMTKIIICFHNIQYVRPYVCLFQLKINPTNRNFLFST